MAYHVTVNPLLGLSMVNYLNVMAELAHPERGYPLDKWLAYDARLRIMAATHPEKLELWSTVHTDIKQRTCLTNSPGSSTSRDHGHKVSLRLTESSNQPFRTIFARDGDFCRRYNRGQCSSETCLNNFAHVCIICRKSGPTRTQCDRFDPNWGNNSRHTAKSLHTTKIWCI